MVLKLKYGTNLLSKYGTRRTQAASWTLEKLPLPSTGNGALAMAARLVTLRPTVGSNRAALHVVHVVLARGLPSPGVRSSEEEEESRPPLWEADKGREQLGGA